MDPAVPLIVPEVNPEDVKWHQGIIANPNCTTIIMLVAIKPLYDISPIARIVVSTYQSASGAGAMAMEELKQATGAYLAGEAFQQTVLPHPYAFNLFSHNSGMLENGYCEEEMKMVKETRKIMHDESIRVCATAVRVPVLRSHAEAIVIEQQRKVSVEEALAALAKAPRREGGGRPQGELLPDAGGLQRAVRCARGPRARRPELRRHRPWALFVCGDQLLKGAALNAVQIAELL